MKRINNYQELLDLPLGTTVTNFAGGNSRKYFFAGESAKSSYAMLQNGGNVSDMTTIYSDHFPDNQDNNQWWFYDKYTPYDGAVAGEIMIKQKFKSIASLDHIYCKRPRCSMNFKQNATMRENLSTLNTQTLLDMAAEFDNEVIPEDAYIRHAVAQLFLDGHENFMSNAPIVLTAAMIVLAERLRYPLK